MTFANGVREQLFKKGIIQNIPRANLVHQRPGTLFAEEPQPFIHLRLRERRLLLFLARSVGFEQKVGKIF